MFSFKTVHADSHIFWRITAGIFLSILLIESVLLVFSWFSERDRLVQRLDESLQAVSLLLDADNPLPQLDRMIRSDARPAKFRVTGFVHESPSGSRTVAGAGWQVSAAMLQHASHFENSTGLYIKRVALAAERSPGQQLWLVVDARWIIGYMHSYVARIIGMVLLISLFVTVACLIFLKPILINPLLRLDKLLVRGHRAGIQHAMASEKDMQRSDELGSVFRSFNLLRNQLSAAEIERRQLTERFESFAHMGADCFWEVDSAGLFSYVTGDIQKVFSLRAEDIVGLDIRCVTERLKPRMPRAGSIYRSLLLRGTWQGVIVADDQHATARTVLIVATPFSRADGQLAGHRGIVKDISKETDLARELSYQARHDELTGLCNRREFSSQLQACLDDYSARQQIFTLVILDLDHFKVVNDTSGHLAGDALLKSLAGLFTRIVGNKGTVARIGGDEFAILMPNIGIDCAQTLAEQLRAAIEAFCFNWEQKTHKVSASIGLAEVTPQLRTQACITLAADSCCFEAKKSGKNQLSFYSANAGSPSTEGESVWISRIVQALGADGFELFAQPIVPIDNRCDERHLEILIRMSDTAGGYWLPIDFLPVAERSDLIIDIDKWVLENATNWLARQLQNSLIEYRIKINISAVSLSNERFRRYLLAHVKANDERINRGICFEMTESAAMLNFGEIVVLLEELRNNGCRVALDDFGTGFSSLAHIRELPLDYIKIDGSFINRICDSELDQTVVRGVSKIAKVLGIETVAEFVDSEDALQLLAQIGIDYAQGYLFAKPIKLSQIDSASDDQSPLRAA